MKTADSIEAQNSSVTSDRPPRKKRRQHPNSLKNLVAPWPKGVSANPGGVPKCDMGAHIARRVLEQNQEAIYLGMAQAAMSGNAYAFKELCERAYGKLKETVEHTGDVTITERLLEGYAYAEEKLNAIVPASSSND